jgi:hypothetical protein
MIESENNDLNRGSRAIATVSIDLNLDNPIHQCLDQIIKAVEDDINGYGSAINRANQLAGLSNRLNMLAVAYLDTELKQRGTI